MSDIFNILLEGGDVDGDGLEADARFSAGGFGPDGRLGPPGGAEGPDLGGHGKEKKKRNRKVRTGAGVGLLAWVWLVARGLTGVVLGWG